MQGKSRVVNRNVEVLPTCLTSSKMVLELSIPNSREFLLLRRAIESKLHLVPFPSAGYEAEQTRWRIQVGGLVHSPYVPTLRKRMLLRILGNLMGLSEQDLTSTQYFERIRPFVCDGVGKKFITVRIGNEQMVLPKRTRKNGHFDQTLFIPTQSIKKCVDDFGTMHIEFECEGIERPSPMAPIHLVPRQGLSIISDIDDTIKDSEINDRRELLANTFLRPFRSIDGMPDVYRQWASRGVHFHYVSSSPWQLLTPLTHMLTEEDFPNGSLHLRYFRLRNHMLQKVIRLKRGGKITALRRVVGSMPERKFLLVGDSGERDMELYASIAKRFPRQVIGVFIRNMKHRPADHDRLSKYRRQSPHVVFGLYESPSELVDISDDLVQQWVTRLTG